MASVKSRGGRFLKRYGQEENLWVELSGEDALTKTTQALREIPAGTSSRALNVERLLEHNRQKQLAEPLETTDLQPLPLATSSKAEKLVSLSSTRGLADSFETMNARNESHDFLDEHELETLLSDSDSFNALVSLMD